MSAIEGRAHGSVVSAGGSYGTAEVNLGRHVRIPRAGGAHLPGPAAFRDYVRRGALEIFKPDIGRVGGITNAMVVCDLALVANLRVSPRGFPALSVAVSLAVPHSMFAECVPQLDTVLRHRFRIEDGHVEAPARPGHGVEFDAGALDRFDVTRASPDPD